MAIHQQQPVDSVKTPASRSQTKQQVEQDLGISQQPRTPLSPEHAAPDEILMLQRTVGNRTVSGLIQAKLRVGPVGDAYEQEADRIADQVMRAHTPDNAAVQRQPEEELQMKPLAAKITPIVQRQPEEEELQMKPLASTKIPVVQRQEDEEELQMKPMATTTTPVVQRQEDEEELQMKPLAATATPVIQRQEDEEELQMKPLAATATPVVQRQEDEEELQMKPLATTATPVVQRQEDEEELQMKPLAATATPVVQRQEDEEELQMKPLATTATPVVQRQEDEEELQMKPLGGGGFQASDEIEGKLRLRRGSGSPLPANLRAEMEARFGVSFDAVRLHKDGEAGQLNEDLRARAFTHGTDIYLGTSEPDIATGEGKRLLAHELTHVVQQNGDKPRSTPHFVQSPTGNTVQRLWGKKKNSYKLADAPTNPDEYMEYLKNNPDKLSDKERELMGIGPSVSKDPVGYVKFLARNQERLMGKKARGLFQALAGQSQSTQEEDPYHDPMHPSMSPLVNKRPPDKSTQTEEDPYHDPYHPSMSPLVNQRPPDKSTQTEEDPYHDPYHPSMSPLVNQRPPDSTSTSTPAKPSKWQKFKGRFSPGMKRRVFPDLSVPASLRKQGAGKTGGLLQGPGVGERPALSARPESEGGRTWQQGFEEPEKKEKGDTDIDKKIEKLEAQLEILKQLKGSD